MSDNIVVDIQDVSKAYSLYAKPIDMLKEMVFGGIKHDLYWALRNISLRVMAGDRLGILGPNGAGKSTLLQIISGNLQPTSGSVIVTGDVSALLSLISVWNLDQTGLETIRFNLLMRGYNSSEVNRLTEEIIDFTELGHFIRQPIKTYSTGMRSRLTFGIGTAIVPDILIVDEILSAGDGYFASKANDRMIKMCDKGRSMLFVSHSINAVKKLCNKAVWIESGMVRLYGSVEYVTKQYEEDLMKSDDVVTRKDNRNKLNRNKYFVTAEDIVDQVYVRVRLNRPSISNCKSSEYYVRDVYVMWGHQDENKITIPLDYIPNEDISKLDIMGSEWGRLYSLKGQTSRILAPRTGARRGGHMLIKRPSELQCSVWDIKICWVANSNAKEDLVLETIDLDEGKWVPCELEMKSDLGNGWHIYISRVSIPPLNECKIQKALIIANDKFVSPFLVRDVFILDKNGKTLTVNEREPFTIEIIIECNDPSQCFVTSLTIDRSDGVNMFWQRSDYNGIINDKVGKTCKVLYHFDANFFSSGKYFVSITLMRCLSTLNEKEHSNVEIYDRKISVASFTVNREYKNVQFGAINYRARVVFENIGDS